MHMMCVFIVYCHVKTSASSSCPHYFFKNTQTFNAGGFTRGKNTRRTHSRTSFTMNTHTHFDSLPLLKHHGLIPNQTAQLCHPTNPPTHRPSILLIFH